MEAGGQKQGQKPGFLVFGIQPQSSTAFFGRLPYTNPTASPVDTLPEHVWGPHICDR